MKHRRGFLLVMRASPPSMDTATRTSVGPRVIVNDECGRAQCATSDAHRTADVSLPHACGPKSESLSYFFSCGTCRVKQKKWISFFHTKLFCHVELRFRPKPTFAHGLVCKIFCCVNINSVFQNKMVDHRCATLVLFFQLPIFFVAQRKKFFCGFHMAESIGENTGKDNGST